MNRPSHYLLLCVLLFVGYLALSGRISVEPEVRPRTPAPAQPAQQVRPPKPRPVHQVAGIVLDGLGFRVVGAEVGLPGGGERIRTDADGQFRMELDAAGPVRLTVSAAGFRPRTDSIQPGSGDLVVFALEPEAPWDPAPQPQAEPAAPAEFAGEGFVRDRAGQPVGGALVTVAETGACARTDDIGRYRLALPAAGPATLVVHRSEGNDGAGLTGRSEPQAFERRHGLVPLPDVTVAGGCAIRGTVRDPRGQPLAGVPLLLRGHGLQRCLLSGGDGVFRIAGLLAGSYDLLAYSWRGAIGAVQQVRLDAAVVDCELRLLPADHRSMRVVDESGRPVPNAYVAASIAGHRRDVAQADEAGRLQVVATPDTGTEFEVRGAEHFNELPLRSVGVDGVLVVAAP